MRKLSYLILAATLSLSIGMECLASDGKARLESGLKAYREEADFDRAILELKEAVRLGLDDRADLIQAHLYLGFAHIGSGQRMAAEAEFAEVIRLDSTLNLDPKLHSTKIVAVFNATKERFVDSLTVVSIPGGAEVYLDGQNLGVTPLRLSDVLIGEHTIRITKEYFQPKALSVRVEKGKDNRVQVQLDKRKIELLITSQPPEAAVYVASSDPLALGDTDGFQPRPHGRTPLSLEMALDQELIVKLAKEEFLDEKLEMKLTEEGVSVSSFLFRKESLSKENTEVKESLSKEDTVVLVPVEDGIGRIHVRLNPAPPPGSLRIMSDPANAAVYLDGILKGETPLNIAKVTPGVRRVRISMSGFTSVTRKVEVISAKETAMEVTLGGQLHILSIPSGAQVFIDGEHAGATPLRTGRIPAGLHQLKLTAGESFKAASNTVVVERGQEKEVKIRLLPVKGSIAVSSDPSGATVYLDGEGKGNTPLFVYGVTVGQYSLKLVKAGCEDWEKQITVEELKVSWQFGKLRARVF